MAQFAIVSKLSDLTSDTLAANWNNTLPFCIGNGSERHIAMSGNSEVRIVARSNQAYFYAYKAPFSGSGSYCIFMASGATVTSSTFPTGSGTIVDGWTISSSRYQPSSYLIPTYDTAEECMNALVSSVKYPITYSSFNSTVSGPSEAAVGDNVTVSAVPDVGYGITDASTQILVTNDDVAVPYTWDAATNHITFTMPDPSS